MRAKRISKLLVAVLTIVVVLSTLALPVFATSVPESTIDMDQLAMALISSTSTPASTIGMNRLAMALTSSTSQQQQAFQFQNFDPNAVARVIVNTIVGLIVIVGLVYGAWQLGQGFTGDDPKEKRNGITAILAALVVGGLLVAIVNMVMV